MVIIMVAGALEGGSTRDNTRTRRNGHGGDGNNRTRRNGRTGNNHKNNNEESKHISKSIMIVAVVITLKKKQCKQ